MTDASDTRPPMLAWRHLVPTRCTCGAELLVPVNSRGVECHRCRRRYALGDRPAKEEP